MENHLLQLNQKIQVQIQKHNTPGAVGLIIKDGVVLYDKAFGYANLDQKTPMSSKSIFRIASQTKAIVPVHLFGQCADMEPILELANEFGLYVIES